VTISCIISDLDKTVSSGSLVQLYCSCTEPRLCAFLLGWPNVKTTTDMAGMELNKLVDTEK